MIVACGGSVATLGDRARAADSAGKVLVVEFYTQWCTVCERFDADVLPHPRVQRAMTDVRFVKLDAEAGQGRVEAERLGVRSYPTFVVIGRDGRQLARSRGLPTVDYFVGFLEGGHVYSLDERRVERRLAADRGPRSLFVAARWAAHAGRRGQSLAYFDEALAVAAGPAEVPRELLAWERSQVALAGASAREWAVDAAAFIARNPGYPKLIDAVRVATLSGGLDDAERRVAADAVIVGASSGVLDQAVYVFVAAGMHDAAARAARALLVRAPGEPRYEHALAVALGDVAEAKRIGRHRAWIRQRMRNLGIGQ